MWVKRNNKLVFLNVLDFFVNLGNIKENDLKYLVRNTKYNEAINIIPPKHFISDFQKAFTILDYQGKDLIQERDVIVSLRALGIEPTADKVKTLIERVTSNKGGLSREDYEKLLIEVINDIDSNEQMLLSFKAITKGASDNITTSALEVISDFLQLNLTKEEIDEMVAVADKNHNGKVDKNEFLEMGRKIF